MKREPKVYECCPDCGLILDQKQIEKDLNNPCPYCGSSLKVVDSNSCAICGKPYG